MGYVPGVSPGYNDRGVRFEKDHLGLSRRLTPDSEPGTLFVAQLEQARNLVDPAMDNLLFVNSFNEWHKDSQIKPAEGVPTNLPLEMTNGTIYEGYGELYVNILRAETCDANCAAGWKTTKQYISNVYVYWSRWRNEEWEPFLESALK